MSESNPIEALQECVLQDQEQGRELVCEVDPEGWTEAVEKPVDEVTFTPAGEEDRAETVLDLEERVHEVLEKEGLA